MKRQPTGLERLGSLLDDVSDQCSRMKGQQGLLEKTLAGDREERSLTEQYLEVSGRVATALEQLNQEIFREEIETAERLLTKALQDVLGQPITLKADVEWKNNAAWVSFGVEREGNAEHIMRGQGGSVANILSVGLRIFALHYLGVERRKVLVLDEQDCWLRPDRVPDLVRLVRQAAHELGFQMIVISHHDLPLVQEHADRIFQVIPARGGSVQVRRLEMEERVLDVDGEDEFGGTP